MPKRRSPIIRFTGDPAVPADVSFGAGTMSLAELELAYVRHVLAVEGGNKRAAARVLGIDRRSLYRRIAWLAGADRRRGGGRSSAVIDERQLDLPGTAPRAHDEGGLNGDD
jgi:hypothetical protein